MWILATDRRRRVGEDSKFEVQNRELNARTIKAVPMGLNDVDHCFLESCRGNIKTADKVLREFGELTVTFPKVDVGADVDKRFKGMALYCGLTK
jgi:hypothetical protein